MIEGIQQEILAGNATQDTKKLQAILSKYAGQSWFALFEIIDRPSSTLPVNLQMNTGMTLSG